MVRLASSDLLFYARVKGYFPLDQLVDAARIIKADYYTIMLDDEGIYSLAVDRESGNLYFWQATKPIVKFETYNIRRSFATFVPRDEAEWWFTQLEKEKLSRDVEIIMMFNHYVDEDVVHFGVRQPNGMIYSTTSHYLLVCGRGGNIHNLIGRPRFEWRAHARVETDMLEKVLADLQTKKPEEVKLSFKRGELRISIPNKDEHFVVQTWRDEGEGVAYYPADDFISMALAIGKYTSFIEFELGNYGLLSIEPAYVPGAVSFLLPPVKNHEPVISR